MKTLLLALSRIKQYFVKNKLIFSLYIIGTVVSGLAFIYFYGNFVSYIKNRASEIFNYRQYTVRFPEPDEVVTADMFADFNNSEIEEIAVGTLIDTTEYGGEVLLCGLINNNAPLSCLRGRIRFSEAEMENGDNVVVIPNEINAKLGDSMNLLGVNFTVIGQHAGPDKYYIPYRAYERLNAYAKLITITAAKRPNLKTETLTQRLTALFPNEFVDSPCFWENVDKNRTSEEIPFICVFYGVAIISVMFLMKYMVDLNAEENIICGIAGATKEKVMLIIAFETTLLSAGTAAVSIFLHYILRNSVFRYINATANIYYTFRDYLFIFAMMLIVSALASLPFLISYARNSLATLKTKYE